MDVDNAVKPWLPTSLVPWGAMPDEALARVSDLSPEIAVQRKSDGGAKPMPMGKGVAADVHAGLRGLIEEATDIERLQAMPPAWQPWL